MNKSSTEVPYGEDEFELAGLAKQYGNIVKCPMVKPSPVKVRRADKSFIQLSRPDGGNPPLPAVRVQIPLDFPPPRQLADSISGCMCLAPCLTSTKAATRQCLLTLLVLVSMTDCDRARCRHSYRRIGHHGRANRYQEDPAGSPLRRSERKSHLQTRFPVLRH